MWRLAFDIQLEVTEDQRLLDGRRYRCLEGTDRPGPEAWTLLVNYGCPKEAGMPIEEADVSLARADGEVIAGFESGRAEIVVDDITGAEQERLDLVFRIQGGEGSYATLTGTIRLAGELVGEYGRFSMRLESESAPGQSDQ